MARGKKTSSKDRAAVISAKIKNPDASLRDIEKETGVNYGTNKDILAKDMPKALTSSHKIIELIDVNVSIMTNGKKVIDEIVKSLNKKPVKGGTPRVEIKNMSDVRSLSSVMEDAFKQNQLLQNKATENVVMDIEKVEKEDMESILKVIQSKLQ